MNEMTLQDTDQVGGGLSFMTWIAQQLLFDGGPGVFSAVMSGQVDYTGVAESQGHYYNMTGA